MNNVLLIGNLVKVGFLALVIIYLPYIAAVIAAILAFDKRALFNKIHQRPEERWLGFLGGELFGTYEDDLNENE